MFPIGHLCKPQVRQLAEDAGLVSAGRRDSYGICFIGKRKMANFLPEYIPVTPGRFVDVDTGDTVGTWQRHAWRCGTQVARHAEPGAVRCLFVRCLVVRCLVVRCLFVRCLFVRCLVVRTLT